MVQKFVTYKQSRISYWHNGSGPQPVICLHGFNEPASSFSVLKNPGNRYTLLAIDAPFHGGTHWQQGCSYTPEDLHEIITIILKTESFPDKQQLVLTGFSMGGRMSLSYYQTHPKRISRLLLLAPDGLRISFWYWFSSHTLAGNRLFAGTMKHPGWLIQFADLLNRLGFINAGIRKFVVHYLHNPTVRETLYKTWTAFHYFKPNIAQIKKTIIQNHTPVQLYFGKYDRVIPAKRGDDFVKGIEAYAQTNRLEAGHRLLQNKTIQALLEDAFPFPY